jgi:hypothetical protein
MTISKVIVQSPCGILPLALGERVTAMREPLGNNLPIDRSLSLSKGKEGG